MGNEQEIQGERKPSRCGHFMAFENYVTCDSDTFSEGDGVCEREDRVINSQTYRDCGDCPLYFPIEIRREVMKE